MLTIKQKPELTGKFQKGDLMTKPPEDYGTGLQTPDDINNKTMLINFARNYDNNAGLCKCKIKKEATYKEPDAVLLQ
jgi:hypothetical protein